MKGQGNRRVYFQEADIGEDAQNSNTFFQTPEVLKVAMRHSAHHIVTWIVVFVLIARQA